MIRQWVFYLTLILCTPALAQAQMYKCKKTNGTSIYQDQPCEAGSVDVNVKLPPVSSISAQKNPASGEPYSSKDRNGAKRRTDVSTDTRSDDNIRARIAETDAYNKQIRCNNARQQLGVAKAQRPIYHYDNNGNKIYVEDANRESLISSAEKRVAEECR